MAIGFIAKIISEKGIGFIKPMEGGADVFFHISVVAEGQFDQLQPGQGVRYELDDTPEESERRRACRVAMCDVKPPAETKTPDLPVSHHPKARRRKPTWRQ